MIKIRPELEMQESDQTWLGKIPGDWLLSRAGGLFKERREKVSDKEFPPLSVTKHGIVPQLENAAKTDDNDNRKKVVSGDYVINSRSDRKGSSGLSRLTGSVSLINTVITPVGIDPFFCNHLLRSVPFQEEYYRWGKGIVADLWSTNFSDLKNIKIPVPNPVEQRQIAAYLNRETAKIDRLIAKQQKLIKLLQEKRQAVISQAVTKGLDPNVKMKDSGVEWLGEIPVHWSKTKIKWNCWTTSGGTPDSKNIEAFYDGQIPWLRTLDLNDSVMETAEVYITEEALKATACKMLPKDTLLVAMYGGSGTIGKNARLGFASTCNQAICAILPSGKISPNFLHFYLKYYRPFWMVDAVGTRKDPNINQDQVRNLEFPLPSLGEQEEIGEFIEREINKIDKLKTKAQGSIELLKEHRQALITAAVTGKIDVRGLVTDEEVAALDADPALETTEEDFESEVAEADYITEEE